MCSKLSHDKLEHTHPRFPLIAWNFEVHFFVHHRFFISDWVFSVSLKICQNVGSKTFESVRLHKKSLTVGRHFFKIDSKIIPSFSSWKQSKTVTKLPKFSQLHVRKNTLWPPMNSNFHTHKNRLCYLPTLIYGETPDTHTRADPATASSSRGGTHPPFPSLPACMAHQRSPSGELTWHSHLILRWQRNAVVIPLVFF